MSLRSHGDDFLLNQMFYRGEYEPETSRLFYRLAKQSRVTLDIGAHIGYYALLAGLANPSAKVYAFEALPTIAERLRENLALNPTAPVEAVTTAVGSRDGLADIYHVESNEISSNASLRKPERVQANYSLGHTQIPVTTVDHFVSERGLLGVDLVKIDTEGTEADVLQGMKSLLARDRPSLLCEVLVGIGEPARLDQQLRPLGYRYYRLEPSGPVLKSTIEPHNDWWNYLFTTLTPEEVQQRS